MKKHSVAVIGQFMYRNPADAVNGQTIKTKNYEQVLVDRYGRENVRTLDTENFKKHLVPNYLQLFSIAKNCDAIFILPTGNGLILMLPVLCALKKIFSFKVLYPVIGGWLPEFLTSNKFVRHFMSCVDRVYPETEDMAKELRELGVKNVETAYNFSLRDKIENEQKELTSEGIFKFCTFSRVTEKKGIGQAIEAVAQLNQDGKIAELNIFGPVESVYQDKFSSLVEENNDCVKYKGVLGGKDIIQVLGQYDLMLFPTYYPGEGMPGAVVEALTAGTPVIASDWHYNKEVVTNGYSGIIYNLEEEDGLITSIRKLISNRTELQNMRENCVEESKRFSAEAVMKPIFQYIEEAK